MGTIGNGWDKLEMNGDKLEMRREKHDFLGVARAGNDPATS